MLDIADELGRLVESWAYVNQELVALSDGISAHLDPWRDTNLLRRAHPRRGILLRARQ